MSSILVIAAHPDDEVLGCGGFIANRVKSGADVVVAFMSDGVTSRQSNLGVQEIESRRNAAVSAAEVLGVSDVSFADFPDNRLDASPLLEIIKKIEVVVERVAPQTVLTHFGGDLNIDHRIVNQAVLTACRPVPKHCVKEILFFEVPSSTEWQVPIEGEAFAPNWFEDISRTLELKTKALKSYEHELREWPHPRSIRAVEHLAHWRGASCGVDAAEAFVLGRKRV
jgi:LmbE family N-acetylglucosaminyl deacetylase